MARIIALHGSVPKRNPNLFVHRNMVGEDVLRAFLAASPPFVSIADALAGRGDALTIDDGTRAAADAALLAREYGHAVSLFVNPGQVISGEPYWFLRLSALMDGLSRSSCHLDGRTFDTSTFAGRQELRDAIKSSCRLLPDEASRTAHVQALSDRWGSDSSLPPCFESLGRAELRVLVDKGVSLENHGWSHVDHGVLSAEASAREILRGREWLRHELGVSAAFFAVPYGDVRPRGNVPDGCAAWLTVNIAWPAGRIAHGTFNREDPNLHVQPRARRQRKQRSAIRHWTSRLMRRVLS